MGRLEFYDNITDTWNPLDIRILSSDLPRPRNLNIDRTTIGWWEPTIGYVRVKLDA